MLYGGTLHTHNHLSSLHVLDLNRCGSVPLPLLIHVLPLHVDMLRRYFERTGCHLAKDYNSGLDHQVALEQLSAEQRQNSVDFAECFRHLLKPRGRENLTMQTVCHFTIFIAQDIISLSEQ